ncbi:hypothetical protein WJX77_002609 [Trebouxia sp. C0004]
MPFECSTSFIRQVDSRSRPCILGAQCKLLLHKRPQNSSLFRGAQSSRSASGRDKHQIVRAGAKAATKAEEEANQKRWKESGGGVGPMDQWRWSLNWDTITTEIVVGSCPRSAPDIDRMVDEAGISAIICLQSDACFEAMQIDWAVVRQQAIERGVIMTRVAVRDFDHNDQALMLPEAVRLLHLLVSSGKRVYVHCTAGINRATLTTVGYLTFVKGMGLDDALHKVKTARPQAHPYVDCWKRVRACMIHDRKEEIEGVAKTLYKERQAQASQQQQTDGFADWVEAENRVIRSTFERQLGCTLSLTASMLELHEQELGGHQAQQGALEEAQVEVERLTAELAVQQRQTQQAQWEMRVMTQKLQTLTEGGGVSGDLHAQLDDCRDDSASLRVAMQHLASSSWSMLAGVSSGVPTPPEPLQESTNGDSQSYPQEANSLARNPAANASQLTANAAGNGGDIELELR